VRIGMAGGLGVPVPEQEAHQGAGDQQGPVGSVGMLQGEPSDRVGGVGVRRKMGGHGDFHSGGQDPPPRWGGPANGAGNSWDLGSMRGSRPEEPGEQGPRQDEQPVHGKDLAQVTVAEEKGGHGSLHGESPSFRFGPGAPAAVNSLETLCKSAQPMCSDRLQGRPARRARPLFNGHALCQVPRLVHIASAQHRDVVRQQLQGDGIDDGTEPGVHRGQFQDVLGDA